MQESMLQRNESFEFRVRPRGRQGSMKKLPCPGLELRIGSSFFNEAVSCIVDLQNRYKTVEHPLHTTCRILANLQSSPEAPKAPIPKSLIPDPEAQTLNRAARCSRNPGNGTERERERNATTILRKGGQAHLQFTETTSNIFSRSGKFIGK